MYKSSREFINLSLDGSRALVEHTQQDDRATAPSILDHYLARPSTATFNTITILQYAQQYTMPKELGAQPNRRSKKVIVTTRPHCSPDPAGPKYEQYCHQSLMKHNSFRQVSDLLAGHDTYTQAYAEYLQAGNVPASLEEDIFRLEAHQQQENPTNTDEVCDVLLLLCTLIVRSSSKLIAFNFPVFYFRTRKICNSPLKAAHNEHKKNGCSYAREQPIFSQTSARKTILTGQQLHSPTQTWRRCLPLSQGARGTTTHLHNISKSTKSSAMSTRGVHHSQRPLRKQQPYTSLDDCHRYSWHREIVSYPMHQTDVRKHPQSICSYWCSIIYHRRNHTSLTATPSNERRFQATRGESSPTAPTSNVYHKIHHHR